MFMDEYVREIFLLFENINNFVFMKWFFWMFDYIFFILGLFWILIFWLLNYYLEYSNRLVNVFLKIILNGVFMCKYLL